MEPDDDGDATMGDSQDSALPPSSPPPLPTPSSEYGGELEDGQAMMAADAEEAMLRVRAFAGILLEASCPACGAGAGCIQGTQEGARCGSCGWGIGMGALEQLGNAFGGHG